MKKTAELFLEYKERETICNSLCVRNIQTENSLEDTGKKQVFCKKWTVSSGFF